MDSTREQIAIQNGHARSNFCLFHGTLKFFISFLTRPEGRRYRSNSLSISGVSLKFGGMMHSNMKQIVILNGHARQFFARSTEL